MGGDFKIISTFSNIYSKCQFKIIRSSYNHWDISLVATIWPYRSRNHPPFHPLATLRHMTWRVRVGGYVFLALVQNFISKSETLDQRKIWCYLEFVFSRNDSLHPICSSTWVFFWCLFQSLWYIEINKIKSDFRSVYESRACSHNCLLTSEVRFQLFSSDALKFSSVVICCLSFKGELEVCTDRPGPIPVGYFTGGCAVRLCGRGW
jgi:hypothetical protein